MTVAAFGVSISTLVTKPASPFRPISVKPIFRKRCAEPVPRRPPRRLSQSRARSFVDLLPQIDQTRSVSRAEDQRVATDFTPNRNGGTACRRSPHRRSSSCTSSGTSSTSSANSPRDAPEADRRGQDDEFKAGTREPPRADEAARQERGEGLRDLRRGPDGEECVGFEGLKKEHDELIEEASPRWST